MAKGKMGTKKAVLDIPDKNEPVKESIPGYLANNIDVEITNECKNIFIQVKPKVNPEKDNESFLSACRIDISDNNTKTGISQGLHKDIGIKAPGTDYQFQLPYYGDYYFLVTSYYTDLNTGKVNTKDQVVTYSISEK
jgi:hypothetical protein